MGMWQQRLEAIRSGAAPLPRVTERLALGRLTRWEEGFIEKFWRFDAEFCTAENSKDQALFGGYIAALADQALAFATMTVMRDGFLFRTSDLHVSFLRTLRDGDVRIEGRVLNTSRRAIHVQADFFGSDNKLAARAVATQIVIPFAEVTAPSSAG